MLLIKGLSFPNPLRYKASSLLPSIILDSSVFEYARAWYCQVEIPRKL